MFAGHLGPAMALNGLERRLHLGRSPLILRSLRFLRMTVLEFGPWHPLGD